MNDNEIQDKQTTDYWNSKAMDILNSLTADKIENIMSLSIAIRKFYLMGKKDGVQEWNNEKR